MRKPWVVAFTVASLVTAMAVVATQASASGVSVTDFSQCANGGSPSTATNCTGWINGAIQSANSHYAEDEVVPQRLIMTVAANSGSHTVSLTYLDRKSGIHAYDSLATYNVTQATADPCQGSTESFCAGTPSTFPMTSDTTAVNPADPGISPVVSAHELPQASRQWTMYGGTLTGAGPITHDNAAASSGDDDATASVTFTAPAAGGTVVLLFGGHLARSGSAADPRAWGATLGASNVSGGPYHIDLNTIDGASAGSRSNGIQAGSVSPGVPSFTITKSASPTSVPAGGTVTYTVTVTNTGTADGSATFTDNFDDRLSPTMPVSTPTGGTCAREPSGTDRYFTCSTSSIPADGGTQTFTYSATMPTSFTTGAGTGGCAPGQYPVSNTATLATGGSATALVCVTAAASFSINKTVDLQVANPGQTVHYTVTVTNTGSAAGATSFVDDFDDRLTPSAVTTVPSGGTCSVVVVSGNSELQCTTSSINAGATQVFSYSATMPTTFTGPSGSGGCAPGQYPVTNLATLANQTSSGQTVCVSAAPSFTISKSASPTVVTPGQTVTYTVTVTNGGTAPGSTTFTDDFDDRLTPSAVSTVPAGGACSVVTVSGNKELNCTTSTIAAGGTQTFTYSAAMPSSFTGAPGGSGCTASNPQQYPVTNTATLSNGNAQSATVCVNAAPAFMVTKSASPSVVAAGGLVTYTVTVSNTGTAAGSTTFIDDFDDRLSPSTPVSVPAGAGCNQITVSGNKELSCTTSTINSGGTQTFTYTATMPSSFVGTAGGSGCAPGQFPVSNDVVLAGGANASNTVCVTAAPAFTISKSASPTSTTPGGVVTYTVTVTNTGTASGSTTFTDDYDNRLTPSTVQSLPGGGVCVVAVVSGNNVLQCTTSTLNAGASQSFSYTATMPASFTGPSGGSGCPTGSFPVTNTATLASQSSSSTTICVTASPTFTIRKTADLRVANPGQTVHYTVTVTNTGTAPGSTTFTDAYDSRLTPSAVTTVPAGGSCTAANSQLQCSTSSIDPGGSQTFSYSAVMPTSFTGVSGGGGCAPGQFPVANTATLANQSSSSTTVCVTAAPSFTIAKTASPAVAAPGQVVTYTVTVTNGGTAAGSTSFTDDYDPRLSPSAVIISGTGGSCVGGTNALQCTTGTLSSGSAQTFTYTATMPPTFTGPSGGGGCAPGQFPVSNTATLAGGDAQSATVCVSATPVFTVVKSASPTVIAAGGTVTYTVTVTNSGTAAGSTGFTDDFDDRLTPSAVQSTPAGGSCTVVTVSGNKELSCTTSTISAGMSQTFTYTAAMPASFVGASGGGSCPTGQFPVINNVVLTGGANASSQVCVSAAPAFTIAKTASPAVTTPGGLVTYTVTVTNTGTASGSTAFSDAFDNRLTPSTVQSNPAGGSCAAPVNSVLQCTTSVLNAGAAQTFTYTATMPPTFTGPSGGGGCAPGQFPVSNTATLTSQSSASKTVCVTAAPAFTIAKSVDTEVASPGQTVHYTLTVTNTGTAAGSTTFTDAFDNRLTPSTVASSPAGGSCVVAVVSGKNVLQCSTSTIGAGTSQTFTYSATVPATFTGPSGGGGCAPGQYPVTNTATLANSTSSGATVCVSAAPAFTIAKTATPTVVNAGATVTYTVTVTNGGTAPGATTFVDDFDARLTPSSVTSNGGSCSVVGSELQCSTGTIEAGASETFSYTAAMPGAFTGAPGGSGCSPATPQQYPVMNTATLANGDSQAATVCVNAAPVFVVAKSASATVVAAGATVTYTVTVSNTGTAAGATAFTDDYDNRLSPSTVTSVPSGGACTQVTVAGNKELSCTTSTINAGASQTFTYSAAMPATFSGIAGGSSCTANDPQQYPVTNQVMLADGANATSVVCVDAAPVATIVKSASLSVDSQGNQFITYTLNFSNTGTAGAASGLVTDAIPAGTTWVSCTPTCALSGSPAVASWTVGALSAHSATGQLAMVVEVNTLTLCVISNTAQFQLDVNPPASSNTVSTPVTPLPDPAHAHANGSAVAAQIVTSGLVNINTTPISPASSSQSGVGGPTLGSNSLLNVSLPPVLTVGLMSTATASTVSANPAQATQTSVAETAHVCILPVAGLCTVEANAVRAVASTTATGTYASQDAAGSTIAALKVVGLATPVNLNQTTTIKLNALIFGKNSFVAINERSGPTGSPAAGLVGSTYQADLTVTMIEVKITGLLGLQAADVFISRATAHSDFPAQTLCGAVATRSVSGHAFVASLATNPVLANTVQGESQILSSGGSASQTIAGVTVPANGSLVTALAGDSSSVGTLTATSSTSTSIAEIAGNSTSPACVLKSVAVCLISATTVKASTHSTANALGSTSTDAGSTLVGLKILGIPITLNPTPNTVVTLPGIGYLVLNEQFCDNGAAATHSCTGNPHSGITVRAIDIVVDVLGNGLGLLPGVQIIVAEAHSDSTFQP